MSAPPFDELDFATRRDPDALRENQRRLTAALGVEVAALHQVNQVHGAALAVADGDPARLLDVEADGLLAEPGSGHAVGVRVADCVPVLLADRATGRVAAVHAGWRGVEARILAHAASRLGAGTGELIAAIGPAIGRCCFEVGRDVGERIARVSSSEVVTDPADASAGGDKCHVDLRRAVWIQLRAIGLTEDAIEEVPAGPAGCTRCHPDVFYSYRRDGDRSGRLIGVIVAGPPASAR